MEQATLDDIIQLNAFTSRMRDNKNNISFRTYAEITKYVADIGEKIRLIKNFLRLKDTEWSLELAMAGLEFGKNEFYKQLRASKSEYKPYYKILNELLFLREDIDKYRERKYMPTYTNISKAKEIMQELEQYNNSRDWADTHDELAPIREVLRVLNDIVTSTGE